MRRVARGALARAHAHPVVVEAAPRAPLITYATHGCVQSLEWFAALLRVDEDGDVADEFLCEERGRGPCAGALRRVAVTAHAQLHTWACVMGGWPMVKRGGGWAPAA